MHACVRVSTYGRTDVRTYVHTYIRFFVRTCVRTYEQIIDKKSEASEKSSQRTPTWGPQPFKKEPQGFQYQVFRAPKSIPGRFKKVSGHHDGFRNAPGVDPNSFFFQFWPIQVPQIVPESEKKRSAKACRFSFPLWTNFTLFREAFRGHFVLRRKGKNELLV